MMLGMLRAKVKGLKEKLKVDPYSFELVEDEERFNNLIEEWEGF